jgi:hypothetical protein
MRYRALNVFESRGQIVVEYEAEPGLLGMLMGMQKIRSMARGQGREWVEERAQSMSHLTEHRLFGPIVDFLESSADAFKKSTAPAGA